METITYKVTFQAGDNVGIDAGLAIGQMVFNGWIDATHTQYIVEVRASNATKWQLYLNNRADVTDWDFAK